MNRIKRVSLFFKILFEVIFIAMPALLIFGWMTNPKSQVFLNGFINMRYIPDAYFEHMLHQLSFTERLMGFGVSAIPMAVELYILYSLIQLFKLYEKGEIFALRNVHLLRNIGYATLLTQIINPIYQCLIGLVLTSHNPLGHRFIAITLDQTNIGIVFMALLIILISWIMAEGCKLQEEQKLII